MTVRKCTARSHVPNISFRGQTIDIFTGDGTKTSLGMCTVRTTCCLRETVRAQKDFSISRQKQLSKSSMNVRVSGAQCSL